MRCTNCDAELAANARFCTKCGTPVAAAPPPAPVAMGGTSMSNSAEYTNQPGQRLDLPEPNVVMRGKGTTGMEYQIIGTTLQAVILELDPGEMVYSESGGMAWMSANIGMQTTGRGGGLGGMFKRAISGESMFLVEYTSQGGKGIVAFASDFPGKIVPVNLGAGQQIIAQKQAFLCAEKTVQMDIHFRKKLGAGFFGGEGFIMQKLTGPGVAFVCLDGEIMEYTLGPGQMLKVDTGHVAMYEPTVTFDIEMMKGFRNILFGGEGLFLATLQGPGRVWLQTMPTMNLAKAIAEYLPRTGGENRGPSIDIGNLLGGS
ncbi:MAG TPA: TIGR00266 family protein [Kouleothrix sp.]|uniref:TIGR00266 family protein n=1 Tax=Kouleothrix sp. TaxID=2779161 RepID=UPI002BCCBA41|nr:TIGR00266 family protein [Kouleothrix sp.]